MARSLNKVFLIGSVGNIETRVINNGDSVATISLATDESYVNKQTGQKVEQTEWHRVVVFGKLAEIASRYVTKGSKLHIEGKLRTREWEKDGVKRYTTEIVMNEMLMLGGGQNQGVGQQPPQNGHQVQQQQAYAQQQQAFEPQQQQVHPQQGHVPQQNQQFAPMPPQHNQFAESMTNSFDDDIPF